MSPAAIGLDSIRLGHGVVATTAADPGSPGRHLWSVRWPAHECRTAKCEIPAVPQRFRHGTAPSYEAARDAIQDALKMGPPNRAEATSQFVNP